MKPYTYLIGWSKLNVFYYGVQYGLKSDPKNLWKTYYTSSKDVKEYRLQHGEPDIVEVRKVFDCPEAAKKWELKVLQRMKVVLHENFLNKNAAFAPPVNLGHSEETKKKISKALKGKPKSKEHAAKNRKTLLAAAIETGKVRKGKTIEEIHGKEAGERIRTQIKQKRKEQGSTAASRPKAVETRRENSGWSPHNEETKKKISQAIKGKKKYNDGSVNKYFVPGTEPSNFTPGFVKKGK